jgi:hypothetical protein
LLFLIPRLIGLFSLFLQSLDLGLGLGLDRLDLDSPLLTPPNATSPLSDHQQALDFFDSKWISFWLRHEAVVVRQQDSFGIGLRVATGALPN